MRVISAFCSADALLHAIAKHHDEALGDNMKTEASKDRCAAGPFSFVAVLACAWPALLLATVCLLPYLNKPFLIDDPHFLTMAGQIVKHPIHPMDFTLCWNVIPDCTKAYLLTPGNSLMGYVLVPTVLSGTHEWTAHLTQLVLVWIAVVAMTSLVLRFGWDREHAIVGGLLLVAIAPFLPMASTAMPDILATALALVAMERLAAWKTEQKWSQGAVSAIALGLAGFARAHLALLLPLAAFYLLESADPKEFFAQLRRKPWLWTPVLAGSGLLVTIIATVREHNLAINPPAVFKGLGHIPHNLAAYLLYLVFPIPLFACWLANRLRSGSLRAAIILTMAAGITWFVHPRQILVWLLAVAGFGVLTDLLYEAWDSAEHTDLFLILWILIPLPTVYYGHLPSKFLLPSMPAVILLCFRLIAGFSVQLFRAAAIVLIVASTGYSLLILRSDAEFARFGRDALYHLIQPHVAAGERIWFADQFSAYWYAPLAGATLTLPGGPKPRAGDLLVVGLFEDRGMLLRRFPHRTLVDAVTHRYRFGRTMGDGIGLYTNLSGYWLWGVGDSANDRYELWRID
jgi:Dolichyl-phosphate-mannose-protein mannosyltransferase